MEQQYYLHSKHEDESPLVALIHKCGSSTISNALHAAHTVMVDKSDSYPVRIAFIRDPIERIKSWYSFLTGIAETGSQTIYHIDISTYESFIDSALSNPGLVIFQPYSTGFQNLTDVYKLSDIESVWPKYFKLRRKPSRSNAFYPHPGINDYRLDELRDLYREDLELWRSL